MDNKILTKEVLEYITKSRYRDHDMLLLDVLEQKGYSLATFCSNSSKN